MSSEITFSDIEFMSGDDDLPLTKFRNEIPVYSSSLSAGAIALTTASIGQNIVI